ncbi:hypothetical protein [Robiginitomaculum antarcticum]|uniref:hypothetical protein n=1 Tax=Robiginitomaculum antarcticum TaxID=437507 RepID=UPI0003A4E6EF|nr:hypothetical protein [Robiginitomaculum antarcticum]
MNTDFENEFESRSHRSEASSTFRRFTRYLSTRPTESWGFFVAGLMIGGFFL